MIFRIGILHRITATASKTGSNRTDGIYMRSPKAPRTISLITSAFIPDLNI